MKKRNWVIIACVLGLPLVAAGGLAGLAWLWGASSTEVELVERDYRLVIDATRIAEYDDEFLPSSEYETYSKLRYIDLSSELSYEYDSPLEGEPYISVSIYWEPGRADALAGYATEWSAIQLGLNLADSEIDIEEDNDIYAAGDRSRFGFMTLGGERFGTVFVVMQGNSVYSFMISGLHVDDPEICEELFEPVLAVLRE